MGPIVTIRIVAYSAFCKNVKFTLLPRIPLE